MGSFFSNLFGSKRELLNVAVFNDPLCRITEWSSLVRFGIPSLTYVLTSTEEGKLVFKPSWKTYGGILFSILTNVVFFYILYRFINLQSLTLAQPVILFGPVLALCAFPFYCYMMLRKSVFDFSKGMYWKGFKAPKDAESVASSKNAVLLNDIGGLQLIRRSASSNGSRNHSFELNLVLKNGDRLNVVQYRRLKRLQKEAQELSLRLGVSLWDASSYRTE